jgi:hypothetical protein
MNSVAAHSVSSTVNAGSKQPKLIHNLSTFTLRICGALPLLLLNSYGILTGIKA